MATNDMMITFSDKNGKFGARNISWSIARKLSCPGASAVWPQRFLLRRSWPNSEIDQSSVFLAEVRVFQVPIIRTGHDRGPTKQSPRGVSRQ